MALSIGGARPLRSAKKMKLPSITHVTGIYAVEDSILHGRFSEIIFRTPKKELRLRCDQNTDEILLSSGARKQRKNLISIAIGSFRVEWMWTMTNQQGYFDGFRIQLATKRQVRVFQFIAIASCIEVYEAHPRPNKTDAGNGSKAICRVSNVLRSPSPDPNRSEKNIASL